MLFPPQRGSHKNDTKALEKYGNADTQARYVEVSKLADDVVQKKLNQEIKKVLPYTDFFFNKRYDL